MPNTSASYAVLARFTYSLPEVGDSIEADGVLYQTRYVADNPETGFQAASYERTDSLGMGTGEFVFAYRGTEFDREWWEDGLTDAGMAIMGINTQSQDARKFSEAAFEDVRKRMHVSGDVLDQRKVTVTGHSLGGTLAQAMAHRFDLRGETFNAFGAAGLSEGVPQGGDQVINHVRATDVVSAASHHYGAVKIYATPEDVSALVAARYSQHHLINIAAMPLPLLGRIQTQAHGIDNFASPEASVMNKANEKLAERFAPTVDAYRESIRLSRSAMHGLYKINEPWLAAGATVVGIYQYGRNATAGRGEGAPIRTGDPAFDRLLSSLGDHDATTVALREMACSPVGRAFHAWGCEQYEAQQREMQQVQQREDVLPAAPVMHR